MAFRFASRRQVLRCGIGALGFSLADYLDARAVQRAGNNRAKSCIVLYCWGGMSHHETWDPKPSAPAEYRGEFESIATAVPGIRIGEHMPRLARHTDKLAIIRSIHHRSSAHGKGMYWNWTGHAPDQRAGNHGKSADDGRLMREPGLGAKACDRRAKSVDDAHAARRRQQLVQPGERTLARGTESSPHIGFA